MSPTKQARGDSGKQPKLHRWQNGEKNLGRNQAQSGGHFSSGQTTAVQFQLLQSQIVRAQLVPVVFSRWLSILPVFFSGALHLWWNENVCWHSHVIFIAYINICLVPHVFCLRCLILEMSVTNIHDFQHLHPFPFNLLPSGLAYLQILKSEI